MLDALSPYNVILGRPSINSLWVMGKKDLARETSLFPEAQYTYTLSWDLILGVENEILTPIEDLKEVQIGPLSHQLTKIETSLSEEEGHELVD